MNKVIWVFGPSAVGKETFIKEVAVNHDLKELIGFGGKKIVVINESILFIKQSENDPIGDRRIEIIDRVILENANNVNTVILIKGQDIDVENKLVEKLKEQLKDVEYEIFLLVSDINTIFERGKKKSWFKKEDDDINMWRTHVVESMQMVEEIKDVKITKIDSTNGWQFLN